ncbi:MAG: amidase family protein [Firmicutes bacterium]|nr:amidase family protein [Bacillota bacterium]
MPDAVFYASIREIHRLYREKKLTVRSLVMSYLSRIAEIDKCAGGLNSVLEINPDALFIADALDKKTGCPEETPPLFGIPILLKDNINTADRLHTSAGSLALAGSYAPYDAHIVKRLREAGAVILGKVNMTEFANFMSDNMPAGYSSRGGQTLNPFNRDVHPGGSSAGSGVAVAAGLCAASVGTETSGSVISPAMQNGIVGIKPTLGLVGRSGIIPICGTHDTAGPMARSVEDAAALLGVIAGIDPDDPATFAQGARIGRDYTKYLDNDGLKGVRIGINRSRKLVEADPAFAPPEEEKAAFDGLCGLLAEAGAVLVDNADIDADYRIKAIMRNEFKACMNHYLSTLGAGAPVKTLGDIIAFNQANAATALKYGQSILLDAQNNTSGTMTEPEYIEALKCREEAVALLDRLFDGNGIDVLLCEVLTNIAPFTGFPCMTIPIGRKKDNVPIGSYWTARRFDEAKLIRAAYAAEQRLGFSLREGISI